MRSVLAALLLVAAATGCAPGGASRAAAPSLSGQPSAAAGGVSVPAELDFALPAVTGGQVDGAELVGKDVALWFWAPW